MSTTFCLYVVHITIDEINMYHIDIINQPNLKKKIALSCHQKKKMPIKPLAAYLPSAFNLRKQLFSADR